MTSSKRILLLYISPESGHHQASLAIEKALHELLPECVTLNVNTLHYMNPVLERVIKRTYLGLIRTHPEVWEYLYDNPKIVKGTQHLRHLIHHSHSPKFHSLLNDFKPDGILCTQAFPCGLVSDVKKTKHVSIPLVGIMTDYLPHSYWLYDNVDFYVVSSEKAKTILEQNGIAREKILPYGIPIDPKFGLNGKRDQTFHRYGLDPEVPTLLLMGGSQGLGPLQRIVKALDQSESTFQMILLCGRNKRLYQHVIKKERHFKKKIRLCNYTDEVDAFMEAATLLITKAGGMTTSEALSKHLPLVLLNPIRGQETANADFLVEGGMAVRAKDEKETVAQVNALLQHPEKLHQMKRCAERQKKTRSAFDVAQLAISL